MLTGYVSVKAPAADPVEASAARSHQPNCCHSRPAAAISSAASTAGKKYPCSTAVAPHLGRSATAHQLHLKAHRPPTLQASDASTISTNCCRWCYSSCAASCRNAATVADKAILPPALTATAPPTAFNLAPSHSTGRTAQWWPPAAE
jgi:hypothetical protein